MIINKEELLYLQDSAKILKANYIMVDNNCIYGSDDGLIFLRRIIIENTTNISLLCISYKDFVAFIKEIDIGDTITLDDNVLYSNSNNYVYCNNINKIYRFREMMNSVNESMFNRICHEDNLKEIDRFNDILAQKSADGMTILNIANNLLSIYSNMLPVVKSDTVELNVYNYRVGTILVHFIIHKKKNINVDIYIPYKIL